jgi:hypothetical protein
MKADGKSRLLQVPFSPGAKRDTKAPTTTLTAEEEASETERSTASALQSLAAELHQAALKGEFDYPRTWLRVTQTISVVLVALGTFHLAMVLIPLLRNLTLTEALLNWRMLGAVLGAGVAFALAGLVSNLFQRVQITPQGLGIMEVTGWRRIPWKQVEVLRVMEISGDRYMVMVPFTGRTVPGTPAPALRLIPLLMGGSAKGERGVVFTSHIKDFERLLQLIVSYMAQEAGQVVPTIEAYVDEEAVMPVGQVLVGGEAAISRLTLPNDANLDPYGMPLVQNDFDVPWMRVMSRQALIALAPALLFFVDVNLRHGEKAIQPVQWLWTALIFALGLVELPYVAMLARTVGELTVGGGQFKRTVWAHLELQAPRALLVLFGVAVIGLGAPAGLAITLWSAGIAITTYLVTRYMMRLHGLAITQALLATVGVLIFQVVLLALVYGTR